MATEAKLEDALALVQARTNNPEMFIEVIASFDPVETKQMVAILAGLVHLARDIAPAQTLEQWLQNLRTYLLDGV